MASPFTTHFLSLWPNGKRKTRRAHDHPEKIFVLSRHPGDSIFGGALLDTYDDDEKTIMTHHWREPPVPWLGV